MIPTYRMVLDSGALAYSSFTDRDEARKAVVDHNQRAREGKERGDMVTLRYAIGIVRIIPKPAMLTPPKRRRGKRK